MSKKELERKVRAQHKKREALRTATLKKLGLEDK